MFRTTRNEHTLIWMLLCAGSSALGPAAAGASESGAGSGPDYVSGGPTPLVLIATPDINQDGKADLVVTNLDENAVLVYLNITPAGASAPTFADPVGFAVGLLPNGIAVADFDGDGRPDVVVTNALANNVSVLRNTTAQGNAVPSFAAQALFATGTLPSAVTVADINNDGKPDLVVTLQEDAVVVLINTTAPGGSISFGAPQSFATEEAPVDVTTADIDGDGRADVIVANLKSQAVSVLINTTTQGSGGVSFASAQVIGVGEFPARLASADFNLDGKPDLVVTNELSNTMTVLLNTTAPEDPPTFAAQDFATPQPWAITTADIDGDGKPDVILTNASANTTTVFMNATTPGSAVAAFAAPRATAVPSEPDSVATVDLNGDGAVDAIIGSIGVRTITILVNTRLLDPVFTNGFE